jgi:predicted MPP superfamily phosphohydrolase
MAKIRDDVQRMRTAYRKNQPQPQESSQVTRRGFLTAGFGIAGVTGLAGAGTTAYAADQAANDLRVTRYKLTPPGWPAGRKLKIAVIADLHASGPNMALPRVAEVVDRANKLGCDLTLLLGDYVAHHQFVTQTVPSAAWAGELARLRAPLGVYAIYGNHDWWHGIESVRAALASAKIPALENDAVLLGAPNQQFWLAGLGCTIAYRLGPHQFRGVDDLPGTMARVTTSDPVILMAHEPDAFVRVPDRVSLTLAGHTHGGQIRVPGLWRYWVPSNYGARFAYGHIVEDERHMIVSGGLGTSIVPLRLGMPPEILHIELGA